MTFESAGHFSESTCADRADDSCGRCHRRMRDAIAIVLRLPWR
ncbi:hypothetical protein BZL30_7558 [Mycobacterium kansasii]|uniref:Uncharacterized protein n=1 Tax=Mycobacterium kansasii TaxID=1768 RepID=A0A1V3WLF7_MYCKA|nr:hypothetical protein BZL30_7558 [Mycobacterium kansasii]